MFSMKPTLKKWGLILFIMLLAIIGGLYYLFGYVPIVGNVIANSKLSKYVGYSVNADYSFPYGDGYSTVLDNGNILIYYLKDNTIYDNIESNLVQNEINQHYQEIRSTFEEDVDYPEMINTVTFFDADEYEEVFHHLHISNLFNSKKVEEDESINMPSRVGLRIINALSTSYDVKGVHIIYADGYGMYECNVSLKSDVDLSEELLIKSTRKLSISEYPEDYLRWLDNR